MKIVIDAGHGPSTPGKRSPDGSLREYQFNSVVARYVADALLHDYERVQILMTHDDSRDVPLKERTDKANAWNADLFVSIHANAAGNGWSTAQGIETFVYNSRPPFALAVADRVQKNLIKATGRRNRGVKAADFHVLRETKMTAILVECGFMTNKEECELLKSDVYRKTCANAIVNGIVEVYGLVKKSNKLTDFPDVTAGHWAEKKIKQAVDEGIVKGFPDGTFRPDEPVTRAQMTVVAMNIYNKLKSS